MTTDPAFRPEMIRGGGRDSRFERREREMQAIWGEAWERADAGDRDGAEELFLEANDLGMSFPTENSHRCALTGDVALGRARVPFTDWAANAWISHGREEQRPTALDRWAGDWVDGNGETHGPSRPTERLVRDGERRLMLPAVRTDGGKASGAESVFRALGVASVGGEVVFDVQRDGTWVIRSSAVATGPHALED